MLNRDNDGFKEDRSGQLSPQKIKLRVEVKFNKLIFPVEI